MLLPKSKLPCWDCVDFEWLRYKIHFINFGDWSLHSYVIARNLDLALLPFSSKNKKILVWFCTINDAWSRINRYVIVKTQNDENTAVSDFTPKILGAFYSSKIWRISSHSVNRLYTRLLALLLRHISAGYLRHIKCEYESFTLLYLFIQKLLWHTFPLFCSYQREIITKRDRQGPFQNPPYLAPQIPLCVLIYSTIVTASSNGYFVTVYSYSGQRNVVGYIVTVTEASNIVSVTSLPLLRNKNIHRLLFSRY